MFQAIWQGIQQAAQELVDLGNQMSSGSREKSQSLIEDWLEIFPRLEAYGFEVHNMAMSVSINPALEAELRAPHDLFPPERLETFIAESKNSTAISLVLNTVKSTYGLYRKAKLPLRGELIVQLRIRLSPEIKVIIGSPSFSERG